MKGLSPSLFVRVAALTTIVVASSAAAQQTAPAASAATTASCEIEQGKPQTIARATLSLTRAQAMLKGGDPTKDLKDIVSLLTAPGYKNENPVGRGFLLASAYVLMLDLPGTQPISPRSAVGIATDPTGTIDLFAAADSAISIVEQSSPGCVTYMAPFRQQKPWLNVTNAAINALNENKLDSAELYARRSLMLDRKAPYAYTVLASVAKARKNYPMMLEYSKQALVAAGTDSVYADIRDRTNYDIAATMTLRAQDATGPDKKSLAKEAIKGWEPLLVTKDDVQGTTAVTNIMKMYIAAGDSLQIGKVYAPMIADPANYAEGTLLQAGVVASQIKRPDDAALLFAAVANRNPYQRDALNNLAASYIQAGENDKVEPIIDKLVALDPSNPDNWLLYAFNYVGLLKTAKDPKLKKQYNDSLVFYNNKSEKMPFKVAFTEFTRASDGTVLAGDIENRGTVAKSFTLVVEFLGSKGEVVDTQTAAVGPVSPKGGKQPFKIKSAKTGIAGYRYKPLV